MLTERQPKEFQSAWFPLNTCSVSLLNIFFNNHVRRKPVHRLTCGQAPENERPCSELTFARFEKHQNYLPPLYGGHFSNTSLFSYIILENPYRTPPVLSSASHLTHQTAETSPLTTGER